MNYKTLEGGLRVSRVALGTWVFGGDGWGGAEESGCISAVSAALDEGVNLIDTAPGYGFGRAETIIGKALAGRRDKAVIATKCGLVKTAKGGVAIKLSAESIKAEVEASLKNLGTDYIDIYQTHWPDKHVPVEETYAAMLALIKEGKVRHIGVCNCPPALLEEISKIVKPAVVQNEYSFLKRRFGDDAFPFCEKTGAAFFAYGPLGGGILSAKYKESAVFKKGDARSFFYRFFSPKNFGKSSAAAKLLAAIASAHGGTAAQAAINWVLLRNETVALVGARNAEQAKANAKACGWNFSAEEIAALAAFEL